MSPSPSCARAPFERRDPAADAAGSRRRVGVPGAEHPADRAECRGAADGARGAGTARASHRARFRAQLLPRIRPAVVVAPGLARTGVARLPRARGELPRLPDTEAIVRESERGAEEALGHPTRRLACGTRRRGSCSTTASPDRPHTRTIFSSAGGPSRPRAPSSRGIPCATIRSTPIAIVPSARPRSSPRRSPRATSAWGSWRSSHRAYNCKYNFNSILIMVK